MNRSTFVSNENISLTDAYRTFDHGRPGQGYVETFVEDWHSRFFIDKVLFEYRLYYMCVKPIANAVVGTTLLNSAVVGRKSFKY